MDHRAGIVNIGENPAHPSFKVGVSFVLMNSFDLPPKWHRVYDRTDLGLQ